MAAAVVAPASHHHLTSHRDGFAAFHQHRGSAPAPRKPFDAFAPYHHSGANSRSAAASSWRHSEPQGAVRQPAPAPIRIPSLKYRRSGRSHSRTPSASSSEASSTSWRSHDSSPTAATRADVGVAEDASGPRHLKASSPFVYTAAELLRLSSSPLVGISKESQDVVDDLVAHHVWRRGAQSGSPRRGGRRNNRGTSTGKPQSLHTSTTDDSEHSD